MKRIVILFTLISLSICGCNHLTLSDIEAEMLIKRTLELPKGYRDNIGLGFAATSWLDALKDDGLITYNISYAGWNTYLYLTPTDKGKPYYLGKDPNDSNIYQFKTNDIDFDKIIGISINKEFQTATVRFTLRATNITPIAYSLRKVNRINYPLDSPIQGELLFKKFDSGWQLDQDQNKSSNVLVNQILDENK